MGRKDLLFTLTFLILYPVHVLLLGTTAAKWQPTPVFVPGESHGRRSLVGYSPRGRKESDMTERAT